MPQVVNRTGEDGNGLPYQGGSAIVDYLGADMCNLGANPGVSSAVLDKDKLAAFRKRFAFHLDADDFSLGSRVR